MSCILIAAIKKKKVSNPLYITREHFCVEVLKKMIEGFLGENLTSHTILENKKKQQSYKIICTNKLLSNVPSEGAGSRLCAVSVASSVPICSCRHPESGSTPARNEATARMIEMFAFFFVEM